MIQGGTEEIDILIGTAMTGIMTDMMIEVKDPEAYHVEVAESLSEAGARPGEEAEAHCEVDMAHGVAEAKTTTRQVMTGVARDREDPTDSLQGHRKSLMMPKKITRTMIMSRLGTGMAQLATRAMHLRMMLIVLSVNLLLMTHPTRKVKLKKTKPQENLKTSVFRDREAQIQGNETTALTRAET